MEQKNLLLQNFEVHIFQLILVKNAIIPVRLISLIKINKILGIPNAGLNLSYVANFLLNSLTGVFDVDDSYYHFSNVK